jgi:hypothetical protein
MLHAQSSLCLASHQSAETRVGVAMLQGNGYIPSFRSLDSNREGVG